MAKITVVCSSNDIYAPYCGAMLTSLFHNNQNHQIDVFILSADMSDKNKKKMEVLCNIYNQKVEIVKIDSCKFEVLPIGNFPNITKETYFRLEIPNLLENRNKCLYLDCDMIVRQNIEQLWNTNLNGYAIAAIKDCKSMVKKGTSRLCYSENESYYNAGMSLYNLKFLRDFRFEHKTKEFLNKHIERILFHDQDIVNAVCHGKFKEVSVRWNMLTPFLYESPDILDGNLEDLENWIENPGIIHYSAIYKPWHKEGFHPYENEFWKYLRMSPWNDLQPTRKFKGRTALFYWVKLKVKFLLGALGMKKYVYRKLTLKDE